MHESRQTLPVHSPSDPPAGNITNQCELRVLGVRRSGIHAVVNWIGSQSTLPSLFLNNIMRIGRNPYHKCCGYSAYNMKDGIQEKYNGRRALKEYRHILKEYLILGYEDVHLDRLRKQPQENLEQWVGISAVRHLVVILRDPYNMLASRYRSSIDPRKKKRRWQSFDRCIHSWKSHARACLGHIRNGSEKVMPIIFDHWFTDPSYRRSVATKLGLEFSDAGLQAVAGYGKGSSFDKCRMDGKAQEMEVLTRWKTYVNEPRYLRFFDDTELVELANAIFGDTEASNEIRGRRGAQPENTDSKGHTNEET